MNRVSLIACAAALMVAWPVVISAQEKTMTTFTGMELVWIPPGEFMMGSTPEEREWAKANGCKAMWTDREGQQPRRTAIKDGYWLARTEMTVGHWRKFVEATGFVTDAERNSKASWRQPKAGFEPKDSHPVTCLSWNDAMAYCRWLTETETKAGTLPKGMVCRLPTEAEWEYACRAGKQTKFWWGDETSGCEKRLNLYGTADGFEYVSPVDSFGAAGRNGFGLADMLGNVWEWCLDEGDPLQAHAECHAGNSESRVLRGASCQHYVGFQRCAVRGLYQSTDSTNHYGFRVCCGVPGGSGQPVSYTTEPLATTGPTPTPAAPLSPKPALPPPAATAPAVGSTLITSTGMELVWIPPGEFMMGTTAEEREWANAHGCDTKNTQREGERILRVAIKEGFWMGRTEVTVGQWKKFVAATGYVTDGEKAGESVTYNQEKKAWGRVTGANWKNPGFSFTLQDNHPVSCISWNDARAYCEWLTETEKKMNTLPANKICRLPTEAEWEYACRAGTQTKFWWGDSAEKAKTHCNTTGMADGFEFVSLVDSFGAQGRNAFGLADMLGNVCEWCLDEFDWAGPHAEPIKCNPGARSLRGGSFRDELGRIRCGYRYGYMMPYSASYYGFRVCCGVPDGSGEPSQNTAPLAAAIPPAELPPQPTAPTVAKTTTLVPPAPKPVAPPPSPAKPQVATAQPSAPAMRAAGVKQTTFEISNLSTSSQYAYVNNAWLHNVPCVEVVLRVNEEIGTNPPNIKAYFFNKDRELVKELTRPTSVSFGNRESFQSPESFKPGKKYTVYFGISEGIQRGKNKWKYAIVLFGNRENATADIHPKEDIAPFDFPEKDLVLKGRGK